MDKVEIIVFSAVLVLVAVRLYQKYVKKSRGKQGSGNTKGTTFSSSNEDDYEPYSKKKE